MLPLVLGEAISRLGGFFVITLVARQFGTEALGTFILGQTVLQYLTIFSDMGFKSLGARLVAVQPYQLLVVSKIVQRRRLFLSLLGLGVGWLYVTYGPVPASERTFLALFILSVVPYALALDWLFLGLERFTILAQWRAGVSLMLALLTWFTFISGYRLMVVALANLLATVLGTGYLWFQRSKLGHFEKRSFTQDQIHKELAWGNVIQLGLALLFNQTFQTVDILLLTSLSSQEQLGLYSAAYRIIFLVLGVYYLFTQVLFARMARAENQPLQRILKMTGLIFIAGLLVSLLGLLVARPVTVWLYGEDFRASASLLSILLFAIPFDFTAAFLGMVMTAWGRVRVALWITGMAAFCNLSLNLIFIPSYGAKAAAWVTLASYMAIVMMMVGYFLRELRMRSEHDRA
jgi:O-antigen/teichoic acid export membrane protein